MRTRNIDRQKTQVLVVEDDKTLREVYELIVSKHGYTVVVASNGEEGLALLQARRPQLVLLDMLMPVLDGLGFLKAAKIAQNYPNTKVVLLSNLSDSAKIEEGMKLGASEVVLKASINPAQMHELIAKYIL